jgi:signal transduction histidine kinase
MQIEDDGIGFTPGLRHDKNGRFGLLGMRERAAEIGAEIGISSVPGEGTVVSVNLPTRAPVIR